MTTKTVSLSGLTAGMVVGRSDGSVVEVTRVVDRRGVYLRPTFAGARERFTSFDGAAFLVLK